VVRSSVWNVARCGMALSTWKRPKRMNIGRFLDSEKMASHVTIWFYWSGREDLNLRPLEPHSDYNPLYNLPIIHKILFLFVISRIHNIIKTIKKINTRHKFVTSVSESYSLAAVLEGTINLTAISILQLLWLPRSPDIIIWYHKFWGSVNSA